MLASPGTASAYLDPSAGNALIYVAVTLVSVSAFAVRSLYYRLTGKTHKDSHSANEIVIFSEGRNYWNTFEPIVNALLAKNQAFSYFTMDIEDPALKIRNKLMTAKYIGEGSAAYARINQVSCKIMLTTTPNIGTPGYPISRPHKVKYLAYVFHDPVGAPYYKKFGLDSYDLICVPGNYAVPAIRFLEKLRNLPAKEIISLGLPYWDKLYNDKPAKKINSRKVILIAPSWGDKGFMSYYSLDFVKELAKDFDIIFRPHPQSRKAEPALLDRAKKLIDSLPNAKWDESPNPAESLSCADLLISDTSAIRLDYAVIYERPVIALEVKAENLDSFEMSVLPDDMKSIADKLCVPIKASEINNISAIVNESLKAENVKSISEFVRENIANLGTAGEHIADYLINKAKEATDNVI
ncbi:MAG: CDP-glycerol glycerophosphotransferase family protein [Synergistaceae bacterium]|nr:CDP-glycerol glycerophosphotransferase family protein [Synergistaceae bacterium]